MPDFAAVRAITAATRKILSTTRAILALTWFCHLCMYLWSLGGGLRSPKGGPPPYTWKKLQCLKMIFRLFGAKKIKKNWIWKMTPADPRWKYVFAPKSNDFAPNRSHQFYYVFAPNFTTFSHQFYYVFAPNFSPAYLVFAPIFTTFSHQIYYVSAPNF